MNDNLRNALEQLRCRASDGWEPLHLLPKEAQALLDERDALLAALRWIATEGHPKGCTTACGDVAHAALAKARNGKEI